jgi:hypothetical protein
MPLREDRVFIKLPRDDGWISPNSTLLAANQGELKAILKRPLSLAILNAVAVFAISNCPDQASETRVFCRTLNYERSPVDNFNNPRLNQAVAEDGFFPQLRFSPNQ